MPFRKDDEKEPGFFEPRHGEDRLLKPGNEGRAREKEYLREKQWAGERLPAPVKTEGFSSHELHPSKPAKAREHGEHGHRSRGGEPKRPGTHDETVGREPKHSPHPLGVDTRARNPLAPDVARGGGTEATGRRADFTDNAGVLANEGTRPLAGPGSKAQAAKGPNMPSRGVPPRGPSSDNRGGRGEG